MSGERHGRAPARRAPRSPRRAIVDMKRRGELIAVVTAYDFPTARLADQAGVEILLVGDSLGTVRARLRQHAAGDHGGHAAPHARRDAREDRPRWWSATCRSCRYQASDEQAVRTPAAWCRRAAPTPSSSRAASAWPSAVRRIVEAGIPVMGHLGLTPQSVLAFGGYKVQARGEADQERLIARRARARGRRAASRSCSRASRRELGARCPRELHIPTIGIGAGVRLRRPGAGDARPARALPRATRRSSCAATPSSATRRARRSRATSPT